ncbi:ubiquitin-related modifier 1, partial [Scenedesmus sp. NREL 46B-D3]
MKLKIEFSGGLELLFGNQKEYSVDVPCDEQQLTVGQLIPWTRDELLKDRPELFVKGGSVRPGILVLINDCDWELSGTLDAELQEGDTVLFISTLHG